MMLDGNQLAILWWPRSAKEIFFDKKDFYIKNIVSKVKILFPI